MFTKLTNIREDWLNFASTSQFQAKEHPGQRLKPCLLSPDCICGQQGYYLMWMYTTSTWGGMEKKKNIQSISSETASFLVGQKMKEGVRQPISRDLLKIRSSSHDDIQTMWFARPTTRHFPLKHMPHAFPLKLPFSPMTT